MRKRIVALAALFGGCAPVLAFDLGSLTRSLGLGGPEVELTIEHPPATALKVTTLAIANPEGKCSDGVAARVEEDFVNAGITVIDRQRFNDILSEHKLQVETWFDQKTAAKIGALVGAQALLFIKVLDCHTAQGQKELGTDKKGNTTSLFKVTGTIGGGMRVVDLTTGKVLASQRFEGKGEKESHEGFPDPTLATGDAEKDAALSVHKLLLPWKETKKVVFYNDSDCNLKLANNMLKAQDLDGAFAQSETNLTACKDQPKIKPATVAKAHYNLGILQFMKDDFDSALTNLTEAEKLSDSKVYRGDRRYPPRERPRRAADEKYQAESTALRTDGGGKPGESHGRRGEGPGRRARLFSDAFGGRAVGETRRPQERNLITADEYKERRAKIIGDL